jgi:hypothetical protein
MKVVIPLDTPAGFVEIKSVNEHLTEIGSHIVVPSSRFARLIIMLFSMFQLGQFP